MEYEATYNIKAVKGVAMKNIPSLIRKKVNPKDLKVTLRNNHLKDTQKLQHLLCGMTPIIVTLPFKKEAFIHENVHV